LAQLAQWSWHGAPGGESVPASAPGGAALDQHLSTHDSPTPQRSTIAMPATTTSRGDHDHGCPCDLDPTETQEWVDSIKALAHHRGPERARFVLGEWSRRPNRSAREFQTVTTPYVNTIGRPASSRCFGNREIEHKIRSAIRWNSVATILRANKESSELGGHIASFQSAATLYDVGFEHFWHAPSATHGGDLIYIQGHSAPGIYARAFVEGRLTEAQMLGFRQEVGGKGRPPIHNPWLMPEFWQFPTVSMGLGPITAIYQRASSSTCRVAAWRRPRAGTCGRFSATASANEPESLGAISLGGREHLDNLIFVINCNLQRLDGRCAATARSFRSWKAYFRGAGWNVIKVIWGSGWDALLAKDASGMLVKRMENASTASTRTSRSKNGAYVREHFFGKYPETKSLVADMSDDEIWALTRGGHDPVKVYAAYDAAVKHVDNRP